MDPVEGQLYQQPADQKLSEPALGPNTVVQKDEVHDLTEKPANTNTDEGKAKMETLDFNFGKRGSNGNSNLDSSPRQPDTPNLAQGEQRASANINQDRLDNEPKLEFNVMQLSHVSPE